MRNLHNDLDQNGSKVEFYEDMFRSGVIKKGGSAYERLQELKGTTEDEKIVRLDFYEKSGCPKIKILKS